MPLQRDCSHQVGETMRTQRTIHSPHTLADLVANILQHHPRCACRTARIQFHEDESLITIEGQVGSYYEKQLVQESIREAFSDLKILNRLTVDSSSR